MLIDDLSVLYCFVCRYESHSGGEREIQRTMLELLNQLDGFDSRGDVKVIMATNRIETLDPALIRPGIIIVCQCVCNYTVLMFVTIYALFKHNYVHVCVYM